MEPSQPSPPSPLAVRHFFITGLPRSRTAWFANYLTFGDSFCLHDGFRGLKSVEDFPARLNVYEGASGNSDPANVLFWQRLVEWYPQAKWVVVVRPFGEVVVSCNRILPPRIHQLVPWENLCRFNTQLDQLVARLDPMIVPFHGITPELAMKVAAYCGVYAGDVRRAEQLCQLNVQLDPTFLYSALRIAVHPHSETNISNDPVLVKS